MKNEKKSNKKNNITNRNEIYMNQENEINKYYNTKLEDVKNQISFIKKDFDEENNNYNKFNKIINSYKESIIKNIENTKLILNNFSDFHPRDIDPNLFMPPEKNIYLNQLERIIVNQIDGEKEKIDKIKYDKETADNLVFKGNETISKLESYSKDYYDIIVKIKDSNIKYLRDFNDYEIKMIEDETNINNETGKTKKDRKNLYNTLKNSENDYKNLLETSNNSINQLSNKINDTIKELKIVINDINQNMKSNMFLISLGYAISNKMQESCIQSTIQNFSTNSQNKTENSKDNNIENNINNNDFEKHIKLINQKLNEPLIFKRYNLLSPFANIDGFQSKYPILSDLKPEIIAKISCVINSLFSYIPIIDIKEQYKMLDISILCDRIFDLENPINKDEENQLYSYLKERKFRLAFLAALNKKREIGNFHVKKKSFMILGNSIKAISQKIYDEKKYDFEILKYLIIMCQTYYAIGKKNHEKIYLIKYIQNSKLFQDESLWNFFIIENVNREVEANSESINESTEKDNNDFDDDEEEEEERKKNKICNIHFSKILSSTQNILEFNIDKNKIKKIVFGLINTKYYIGNEYQAIVEQLIDETNINKKDNGDFDPDKEILDEG